MTNHNVKDPTRKGVMRRSWNLSILDKHALPTMPVSLNSDEKKKSREKICLWLVSGKNIRTNFGNSHIVGYTRS